MAIAHRHELVSQISMALAREDLPHRVIGSKETVRSIVGEHMNEFNRSFYTTDSPVMVASVDTLIRRDKQLAPYLNQVGLWVQDEAHHLLKDNKWGKAAALCPNAFGLGVTATPTRADGKGLGRHAEGVMDDLVIGPSMRELITLGNLTDYRIFAPTSDMMQNLTDDDISDNTGDYKQQRLAKAAQRSHIVGDVVEHYLRIAPGRRAIVFAVDVRTAGEIAGQLRAVGVRAECVTGTTDTTIRNRFIRQFRDGHLDVLVNVDLFGEGFDLPAVEVVIMARPTKSYSLYAQQFGRALRPMPGKSHAIIIDHVNNVDTRKGGHGLPDAPRIWTLDSRSRRKRDTPADVIPTTTCEKCLSSYERIHSACPYCGAVPTPQSRKKPEFVDGDLYELSAETLQEMRGEINKIDKSAQQIANQSKYAGMSDMAVAGRVKHHTARQESQRKLRNTIAWWGGYAKHMGWPEKESYRRFYFKFGIDVLSAQALNSEDALKLEEKISNELDRVGVQMGPIGGVH